MCKNIYQNLAVKLFYTESYVNLVSIILIEIPRKKNVDLFSFLSTQATRFANLNNKNLNIRCLDMENHQKLSQIRRDAIANAVDQTIDTFSDKLPPKANSLCLYYANLGMEVCTVVYREVTQDKTSYYSLHGGSIRIRATSDPNDTSKAVSFGAKNKLDKPSFENGRFHCWIVGLCKDNQLIIPNEFIDFTSRHYKSNALEQHHEWEREDIGDYLWLDNQGDLEEKYGVSVMVDETIQQKAREQWLKTEFKDDMLRYANKTYLSMIKLNQ